MKDMIGEWRFRVNKWLKLFECNGRLVAVEETEAGEVLTEFTLDTDLDQITLKQNSVVLADKPQTPVSHKFITNQKPLRDCKSPSGGHLEFC